MFSYTGRFNQDISGWKTDKVVNMNSMFSEATAFNQDISTWNISNVKYMDYMFKGAVNFEQDLNGWDVTGKSTEGMFEGSAMETQTHWHPTGCACGQQHEEL